MSGIALGAIGAAAGLALQLCGAGRSLRTAGFAAYAAGVLILAGDLLHSPISTLRTDAGRRPALAAAGLLVGLAAIGVAAAIAHREPTLALISDGWRVIKHQPIDGAGLGGFARAALAGSAHPNRTRTAASHTTPVTVLAELGPLGLAAYLALVGSIAWAAFRPGQDRLLRFGLAAALAAVLTSSLFYNAYFEDPASWILTALIVSVAALPNIRIRQAAA